VVSVWCYNGARPQGQAASSPVRAAATGPFVTIDTNADGVVDEAELSAAIKVGTLTTDG
jgi:hypothetical protein